MGFADLNYLAIVIAAVAAFAFGAVFYGALGKQWMRAARIEPGSASMSVGLMATSFLCELVMAAVLAAAVGMVGTEQVTVGSGVSIGLLAWLGFVVTTMAVNHRYKGFGWDLTLIDGAHWLGVAVLMGAIIGWFASGAAG